MADVAPPPSSRLNVLIGLVEDVFRLGEAIYQNDHDHRLKSGEFTGGAEVEFHYLVDTPLFTFYAEPALLAPHLATLPSLEVFEAQGVAWADPDEMEDMRPLALSLEKPVLHANALLTAEFIFSSAFVGAGERLLFAPEHEAEFASYLLVVEKRLKESRLAGLPEDRYEKIRRNLSRKDALFEDRRLTAWEWLGQIAELIEDLAGLSHSQILAPHRIVRLLERDLLTNAASHPAYTRDVLAPPPALVRAWRDRIASAKKQNPKQPSPTALWADATTLAQLSMLNAPGPREKRVFVLITEDRGLHRAYSDWVAERDSEGHREFFALRRCRQYIPILNIKEMGGRYVEESIFHDLKKEVFSFIDSLHTNDVSPGSGVERLSPDSRYRTPSATQIRNILIRHLGWRFGRPDARPDHIEALISEFRTRLARISSLGLQARSFAVTAKADVIADAALGQSEYLRKLMVGMQFKQAFVDNVRELSGEFDKLTAASVVLRHEIWALDAARHPEADLADHGRRVVASEFAGFRTPAFHEQRIATLTAELPKREVGDTVGILAEALPQERHLVLGALCLEIGAWAGALNMLQKAETGLPKTKASSFDIMPLRREIQFFRCVARRVGAEQRNWEQEYEQIEAVLNRLLDNSPDRSGLDGARIRGEQLALEISRLAWLTDRRKGDRIVRRALAVLEELEEYAAAIAAAEDDVSDPWSVVRNQVRLNTLILAFWWKHQFSSMDGRLAAAASEGLAYAERQSATRPSKGLYLPIYPGLAEYALTDDRDRHRELAAQLTSGIDAVLARDTASGFAFDIANVDKVEYAKIKSILSAGAKQTPPVAPGSPRRTRTAPSGAT